MKLLMVFSTLLLHSVIGLKILRQFFNQCEGKIETIRSCTRDLSRALLKLQVVVIGWFSAVFAVLVIGRSNVLWCWVNYSHFENCSYPFACHCRILRAVAVLR